jgi:translocation and assembly module TamA
MNARRARWLTRYVVLTTTLFVTGFAVAAPGIQVTITGLEGPLLENARAAMGIIERSEEPRLDAETINRLHQQAPAQIRRALQPFGYYRVEVNAQLEAPAGEQSPWRANYTVDRGTAVPLNKLDLRFSGPGADAEELQALAEGLPLQLDDTLDHRHYESAKRELLSGSRELGFLDAELAEHRIELDLESYSANIVLRVETGQRHVIGPIQFQQEQFSQAYLERYLILTPGEAFRHSQLSQQRRLFSASGHFAEVSIEQGEPIAGENPQIPLVISLTPFPANRYRGRVGWGTDTGFGLGVDWTRRYLGKRGHQFNAGAAVAEERERLAADLSYTIPLAPLTGSALEITARHESKDLTFEDVDLDEGGETRIATNLASLLWHRPVSRLGRFDLLTTAGISLVEEDYDIFEVLFGNLPREAQEAIIGNIGQEAYETLAPEFEAIVPALRFNLRRADDPLYIRRGDYLNLELLGADEGLGSNISFWQARLSSWNIWPIADQGRFLLRTNLGYTDAESRSVLGVNFNQMPEYFEFRAGGARSIRGYGWETLFPDDAITGGKHLLVASVEYEHEIIPDWSVAAFLDGGNAFNKFDDFEEKLGAGLGVRWRSPVGLARIDLGIPLDDADDSFQIYITVGPEF